MTTNRWAHAVVVGASSGIGEALARHLGAAGVTVALVARRAPELERICEEINAAAGEMRAQYFLHDVRDRDSVETLMQRIAVEMGGLDLVVYSTGILPHVGPQEYPTDTDALTVETNVIGAIAWLNAAAQRFYQMRSGTIIALSSVAGERGRRGNPVYNASKAALNVYLEGLRSRLASRGVNILTVKPGWVRTPMLSNARFPLPVASPEQVARETLVAAAAGRRVVYVPGWWRWISLALHLIPSPLFERLPVP